MITFVFAFVGSMLGGLVINYILHEPNKQIEYHESKRNQK